MNTDNSAIIDDYISKEEEKNAENKSWRSNDRWAGTKIRS
jgi:hypothetical protein